MERLRHCGSKTVDKLLPIHVAQLVSYMKFLNVPVDLLFKSHELALKDGLRRLVLKGAEIS